MIDCKNCLHSGLCLHEDKAEEYIKQHEAMRDKCSLFDGEPTCNRFIDNKALEDNKSLKECIEIQQSTIYKLSKTIRDLKRDKIDINNYERKISNPKIYTCTNDPAPKITYSNQSEDERTVTKDDKNKYDYFYQGKKIDKRTYDRLKWLDFILN